MKNKGFSLVEMIIAVALIVLLASTGYVSFSKRAEKNALIKMKTQIHIFIENTAQRSLEEGVSYTLNFNFSSNTITSSSGDELDLETILYYGYMDGSDLDDSLTLVSNTRGDFGSDYDSSDDSVDSGTPTSYNIYIFNSDGDVEFRIEMENNLPTNYLHVQSYEPNTDMNVDEIEDKINNAPTTLSSPDNELLTDSNWDLK